MKLLEGKVIVITGGASGIGRAIAERCVSEGAHVAIAARSQKNLDETLEKLKSLGATKVLAVKTDVTKDEDLKNLFNQVSQNLGPVYGLIPAAGIYGAIGPFLDGDIKLWGQGVEINLIGLAKTVYYGCKQMSSDGGRVILWSGGGQGPLENFSDYVAGKGGVWRLTETLGVELAKRNIFVNSIAPGAVNTGFLDDLLAAGPEKVGKDFYEKSIQQQKKGGESPTKTADLCVYLLSEKSKGLYGKTISAVWDDYQNWENLESLSKSDVFTYKRVIDENGSTRVKK